MSDNQPPASLGRSIASVLAGILVIVILSIGTDAALHAAGVFPKLGEPMSDALLLLATAYRTIYGVLGGYVTARIAVGRPMQHALLLGAIGIVLGTIGAAVTWNMGSAFGRHWYPVALVILAVPQCWAGGALRVLQLRTQK